MNRDFKIKLFTCVLSFIIMFLLLYPIHRECAFGDCFVGSLAVATLFASAKYNEIDFLKGKAFYGGYIYGGKIPSIEEDSSEKNILRRRLWFGSLIFLDSLMIILAIKFSWVFN